MTVLPSVLVFTLVFFGVTIILGIVEAAGILELPKAANFIALVFSGMFAGKGFVNRNERPPSRSEAWRFALGAYALSTGVSVALFVFLAAKSPALWPEVQRLITQLGASSVVIVFLMVSALYLALMYFSFGTLTRWTNRTRRRPARRP